VRLLTRDLALVCIQQLLSLGLADAALAACLSVPDASLAWNQRLDAVQKVGSEIESTLLPELLQGEKINQELRLEAVEVNRVNLQELELPCVHNLSVVLIVHRLPHHLSGCIAIRARDA